MILVTSTEKKKILIFGGTTEGRAILSSGIPCVYSAATAYGAELAGDTAGRGGADQEILCGRLTEQEILELALRPDIAGIIDATHPYALEAGRNIASAARRAEKPFFRIERARSEAANVPGVKKFAGCKEAAEYLASTGGNILVTTGSKEIHSFTAIPGYEKRAFFRVLPTSEVILKCEELGVPAGRIIAAQGPFSALENRAHIERASAKYLVTKDGGPQGGMAEKLEAARRCKADVILIERPGGGESFAGSLRGTPQEALEWARNTLPGSYRLPGPENLDNPRADTRSRSPMFPMFIGIKGKTVLVVGGGEVALRKSRTLVRCGAALRVVAPHISPEMREMSALAESGRVIFLKRPYAEGDMDGADMAVAATDDRRVNRRVAQAAANLKIPVNVADAPGECSFFFPAFVEHRGYAAGISSSGQSPAKSRELAARLRTVWKDWIYDIDEN